MDKWAYEPKPALRSMTETKPSDLCLTLAAVVPPDGAWLAADEVRGRLVRLGFTLSTQQVAAYLKRLSRMDAPPIEVREGPWGDREYQCSRFGRTWLCNNLEWTRQWR